MLTSAEALAAQAHRIPEDVDPQETQEFLEAIEAVTKLQGADRARYIVEKMIAELAKAGAKLPQGITTPYVNTILPEDQPPFPGDRALERKIKSLVRWNAMAMVDKANRTTNVGGHIATFASAATLYEIGWNHFFRGRTADHPGDVVFFQGHAAPGMYARAFVEGRLDESKLDSFRRELNPGGGLSSYPHPWLMPDFWQYPTVSMGLGPIMSIYHARFNRYLRDRKLRDTDNVRIWAYLGDGECDEPETLGCIGLAGREKLDNLTWVINCNLQRLDGPVRGNGKIIQELEGIFRGANWNVIKVIWGSDWDALLKNDHTGALARRMMEVVDGEYQEYIVKGGKFIREKFFNTPELRAMVEHLSDEQIEGLKRGGHDPVKVYTAYKAAVEHKGQPTVILVKTVKGYGTPSEGKNVAHQDKKLVLKLDPADGLPPDSDAKEKEKLERRKALSKFRDRFQLPISDDHIDAIAFYRPSQDAPEIRYLHERRKALGGYNPSRSRDFTPSPKPDPKPFEATFKGTTQGKGQSTTLAWVSLMTQVMRDANVGKLIVPIVPDEGQTFGMPPMYKAFGIYNSAGQIYNPVDKGSLTEYRESTTGQIFQEGINEAGSMASFIAAGTAYNTHGINMVPFYVYYSMFGFQRVGDLIWAAADSRCRGFLLGATAGRTTINGEGLQHEDGHSHLVAMTIPSCRAYDPAFAYELAVIVQDGMEAMFTRNEECFYYLTVYNESYEMPPMPEGDGIAEGILKGLYPFKSVKPAGAKLEVQLLGSGVIMNEVLRAQQILAEKYNIASTVFSATSYQALRRDAITCERHNRLHPTSEGRIPYVQKVLGNTRGPVIASSDYMRSLPESLSAYVTDAKGPRMLVLGTDGFGRSDTRKALRRFFEVDAENVTVAALAALAERGELDRATVARAIQELGLNPDAPAPWTV